MHILLDLFLTFAKIGAFTFGGGYAMISLIEDTCVEKKKWISHEDMMDITIIAESTPGPVAINCATFVGNRQAGFVGAAIATLGMTLPSFLIIYLISQFLDDFLEIPLVAKAFHGIQLAVAILILNVGLNMMKKMLAKQKERRPLFLFFMTVSFVSLLLAGILSVRISSISLMVGSALVSILISSFSDFSEAKEQLQKERSLKEDQNGTLPKGNEALARGEVETKDSQVSKKEGENRDDQVPKKEGKTC